MKKGKKKKSTSELTSKLEGDFLKLISKAIQISGTTTVLSDEATTGPGFYLIGMFKDSSKDVKVHIAGKNINIETILAGIEMALDKIEQADQKKPEVV